MNRCLFASITLCAAMVCAVESVEADTPGLDAFNYQAQLVNEGEPAVGPLDLRFRLFDAETSGNQVGPVVGFTEGKPFVLKAPVGPVVFGE